MKASLDNVYDEGEEISIQDRIYTIEWQESRDQTKHVPVIHVPHCRPDMICQKIAYRNCQDEDKNDCTKYPPGEGADPSTASNKDKFPICNPPLIKEEVTGV